MREKASQETQEKIIDALINERKRLGLSHEKLAELSGLHRTAISHIENRKRNPTLISCLKISYALGISLGDILKEVEQIKK